MLSTQVSRPKKRHTRTAVGDMLLRLFLMLYLPQTNEKRYLHTTVAAKAGKLPIGTGVGTGEQVVLIHNYSEEDGLSRAGA